MLVWLLVAAALISIFSKQFVEAGAIAAVLLLNATIGFLMELRATRSMEALFQLNTLRTRVRREGHDLEIAAADLVRGDIVLLEAGDIVPADMRVLQSSKLEIDESSLTGESIPVWKETCVLPKDTPLVERANMLFKGSAVAKGSAVSLVTGTGMSTELGRIRCKRCRSRQHQAALTLEIAMTKKRSKGILEVRERRVDVLLVLLFCGACSKIIDQVPRTRVLSIVDSIPYCVTSLLFCLMLWKAIGSLFYRYLLKVAR